ncbi:MAG: PAS domain S-box protein [Isosphaeraceae bacterium]|nr:PAS domain S-box protein [Isosphaeraceae bacterium]
MTALLNGLGEPAIALPDRSDKLYKMLLDSIPSSALLVDSQLRVVSANRNFFLKSRIQESNIAGQRLEEVFPPILYQHMNLKQRVVEVFQTGEALNGERMVYRASGHTARYYYYRLIPFNWKGRIENVLLLMEDVTEMVRLGEEANRAVRHLASVVESANDLVTSTDVHGRIVSWNTAASQITGYSQHEVLQTRLPDLCEEASRPLMARMLESLPDQGRTEPIELDFTSRDGHLIPISWVCSPMRDDAGKRVGMVAVGRDLTERRKLEAQLLQSEKLAALGVMAGGIAHEVRNPLAVVSCAAQMLLEDPLSPQVQFQCAEKIYRCVQRASGIIESLLRFARSSNPDIQETLDFIPLVMDAVHLVADQLRLSRIELTTHFPAGPAPVQGIPDLLRQVVTNLLLNAAHAMEDAPGVINLDVVLNGPNLALRVADSGRGISKNNLPKVFDPFFTTMPAGKGTGLGLSICYAIVQQHKGRIEIHSQENVGTSVTVILPREPL